MEQLLIDVDGILSAVEAHEFSCVYEHEYDVLAEIIEDYNNNRKKQSWPLIKTSRLAKILRDYAISHVVRDEMGVIEIAEQIILITARLYVNTILCGHSRTSWRDYVNGCDCEIDDLDSFESFTDDYLFDDEAGQYRISDYALSKLMIAIDEMVVSSSAEELLSHISIILNICHMRSDLSSWFIEGGSAKLRELNEMPLYMPDTDN